MKVLKSNYAADSGGYGYGIINIATKRGDFGLTQLDRTHMFTFNFVYELPRLVYELPRLRAARGVTGAVSPTPSASRGTVPRSAEGRSVPTWSACRTKAPEAAFRGTSIPPLSPSRPPAVSDLNIFKNFRLKEQARIRFGAEFFNAFNHPQFEGVGTTVGASTFGVVTSAGDPRIIQLRLKLSY